MSKDLKNPNGALILRTLAMPADTNANGDIFGGWILSQMDLAAGILARDATASRAVTVAMDGVKFIKPVKVGDVVCCYGDVIKIGRTSVTLKIETWVNPKLRNIIKPEPRFKVTEASFIFVAIDEDHNKKVIDLPDTARIGSTV
jgi:acyl-CoA thioesterase YciA